MGSREARQKARSFFDKTIHSVFSEKHRMPRMVHIGWVAIIAAILLSSAGAEDVTEVIDTAAPLPLAKAKVVDGLQKKSDGILKTIAALEAKKANMEGRAPQEKKVKAAKEVAAKQRKVAEAKEEKAQAYLKKVKKKMKSAGNATAIMKEIMDEKTASKKKVQAL